MKFALASTIAVLLGSVAAAPANLQARAVTTLRPDFLSVFHSYNGAIEYQVGTGISAKGGSLGQDIISTLTTFTFPSTLAGKKCTLNFFAGPADTVQPVKAFDVFSTNGNPPGNRPGWGPGNQRNNQLARFKIDGPNSYATFDTTVFNPNDVGKDFNCPSDGLQRTYEVVPVGDQSNIRWSSANGLYLTYV